MLLHEFGHLKVTYLGHGEQATPPRIRGANPRERGTGQGESGEFFERGLFGGLIEFHIDQWPHGDRGFPWIYVGRNEARRADINSIVRLMRGIVPQTEGPVISLTNTSTEARELENERPRVTGSGIGQQAGTIMGVRARSEQPLSSPSAPRLPGSNLPVDRLRQLTASPSPVPTSA